MQTWFTLLTVLHRQGVAVKNYLRHMSKGQRLLENVDICSIKTTGLVDGLCSGAIEDKCVDSAIDIVASYFTSCVGDGVYNARMYGGWPTPGACG